MHLIWNGLNVSQGFHCPLQLIQQVFSLLKMLTLVFPQHVPGVQAFAGLGLGARTACVGMASGARPLLGTRPHPELLLCADTLDGLGNSQGSTISWAGDEGQQLTCGNWQTWDLGPGCSTPSL